MDIAPPKIGRIVAIDYGTKRVGLAVSDPLQVIASPLTTVSSHLLFTFLTEYTQKEIVSTFVVGMPYGLNDKPVEMVAIIERMVKKLKKEFPKQLCYYQDERLTSKIALQALYQAGFSKKLGIIRPI